jgi:hypothetical protein
MTSRAISPSSIIIRKKNLKRQSISPSRKNKINNKLKNIQLALSKSEKRNLNWQYCVISYTKLMILD